MKSISEMIDLGERVMGENNNYKVKIMEVHKSTGYLIVIDRHKVTGEQRGRIFSPNILDGPLVTAYRDTNR